MGRRTLTLLIAVALLAIAGAGLRLGRPLPPEPDPPERTLSFEVRALHRVAAHLNEWREEHGRYPTNEEGLAVLVEDPSEAEWFAEVACRGGSLDPDLANGYPLDFSAGLLTPLYVPFVYENCRDAPDRPPPVPGSDMWSVAVDEGVTVWASAGPPVEASCRRAGARYRSAVRERKLLTGVVVVASLIALISAVFLRTRRTRGAGPRAPGAIGVRIAMAILAGQALWLGCGPVLEEAFTGGG